MNLRRRLKVPHAILLLVFTGRAYTLINFLSLKKCMRKPFVKLNDVQDNVVYDLHVVMFVVDSI